MVELTGGSMPAAIEYVPPTDKERDVFNQAIIKERDERRKQWETALRYYKGNPDPPLAADPNDPDYDPSIDNATINLAKMAGDRTVSFLFPEMPDFQTDPDSVEDTPEEAWLKDVFFPENGGLEKLSIWALRGFLAGHSFVWLKATKTVPKMVILHPMSVTVFWAADDVADILWYEMRYFAQGKAFIRDFVKQDDGTWLIYEYEGLQQNRSREIIVRDQITAQGNTGANINLEELTFGNTFNIKGTPKEHSSSIPPIIATAHLPDPDNHYGQGEFTQRDLQDIINKITALRNRIVREYSDPVDVVDGDIDDVVDAGSIIAIPQGSKVTRLTLDTDLKAINDVLNDLIEKYLAVSRVVILKGEAKDLQRVTNAAVRTLFLDALAKNSLLRSAYGNALAKICQLALEMAYANNLLSEEDGSARPNPESTRVEVKFASPLPTDLTEVANINAISIANGTMSIHSGTVALGLNPAFETKKKEAERLESMEQQKEQLELQQQFAPTEEEKGSQEPQETK